jgi:hypothetical protein
MNTNLASLIISSFLGFLFNVFFGKSIEKSDYGTFVALSFLLLFIFHQINQTL